MRLVIHRSAHNVMVFLRYDPLPRCMPIVVVVAMIQLWRHPLHQIAATRLVRDPSLLQVDDRHCALMARSKRPNVARCNAVAEQPGLLLLLLLLVMMMQLLLLLLVMMLLRSRIHGDRMACD